MIPVSPPQALPPPHRNPAERGRTYTNSKATVKPAGYLAPGGARSGTPILWVPCGRARVVIGPGGRQHTN